MTKSKRCRICGGPKPLTEFYRAKNNKDGRRTECRTCFRKIVAKSDAKRGVKKKRLVRNRAWYYAHRDYFKKYKRRYTKEHRDEIEAYFKAYYEEHKKYSRRKKREYRSDRRKLARMRAYNREWWRRKRVSISTRSGSASLSMMPVFTSANRARVVARDRSCRDHTSHV